MKRFGQHLAVALGAVVLALTLNGCARPGTGSAAHETDPNIIKLTKANFEQQVLASSKPVVVDFWAPWCGPCLALAPTISEIAAEYKDRVVVGKVNVDDETALSEKYNIEGIPAIFIFKDGKPAQQLIGLREKKEYQDVLNKLLASATPAAQSAAK